MPARRLRSNNRRPAAGPAESERCLQVACLASLRLLAAGTRGLTGPLPNLGTDTRNLQERPEDVPTGELPRHLLLLADRTLVGTVAPGARVTVTGIYSIYTQKEQSSRKDSSKSGVAVRQPYIRAISIAEEQDQGSRCEARSASVTDALPGHTRFEA